MKSLDPWIFLSIFVLHNSWLHACIHSFTIYCVIDGTPRREEIFKDLEQSVLSGVPLISQGDRLKSKTAKLKPKKNIPWVIRAPRWVFIPWNSGNERENSSKSIVAGS